MRKIIGGVYYLVGAFIIIVSLQIFINCDLIGVFSPSENMSLTFSQFLFQSSGHHLSYPNGYLIHLVRDLILFGFGALIIIVGHENFLFKEYSVTKNVSMLTCPQCHRKTYADAYCRFCGFNLITLQASRESILPVPFWKVSLFSYIAVSVFLVVMNLLMIKA
jgi:lipid-A-disaccharide synthase-like uncharacterized protein